MDLWHPRETNPSHDTVGGSLYGAGGNRSDVSSQRAHDPQKIFSVGNVKYIEMVPKDSVSTSEETHQLLQSPIVECCILCYEKHAEHTDTLN
jgi:hypothetical protein